MSFGNSNAWTIRGKLEILKVMDGFNYIRPVIIDSSSIPNDADGNKILLAGTILARDTAVASGEQLVPFTDAGTQTIQGILAYDVAAVDGTTKSDVPAAILLHSCVFRKDRIIGYNTAGYAAKLATAMPTCRFE